MGNAQPEVEGLIDRSETLRKEVEALTIESVNPCTEELAAKAKQLSTDTFNIATTWLEHVLK
ncbi:hypothetical protein [Marinomonas gallaica]|uniref:hypothetical protein n=1 Tax=Marinomonas gallaica TaxID=1806667 RepID=UPI003A9572FC